MNSVDYIAAAALIAVNEWNPTGREPRTVAESERIVPEKAAAMLAIAAFWYYGRQLEGK